MRAYFLTLQYWLAGSEENIANMVRLLVRRYASGARAVAVHASASLETVVAVVGCLLALTPLTSR